MKIYIGADHRGFNLKNKLVEWLLEEKKPLTDLGAATLNPHDDYTVYAEKVASLTAADTSARGILLCGSGVGVDIVANKFDGVRASIGLSVNQVAAGRSDDDMNILVIAADFTDFATAKKLISAFLETPFSKKARYTKRLETIVRLEENN